MKIALYLFVILSTLLLIAGCGNKIVKDDALPEANLNNPTIENSPQTEDQTTEASLNEVKTLNAELDETNFDNFEKELDEVNW